jgi:hypothetical protein
MKNKNTKKENSELLCLECLVPMNSTHYDVEDLREEHQIMLVLMKTKEYRVVQCPKCKEKVPIIVSRRK